MEFISLHAFVSNEIHNIFGPGAGDDREQRGRLRRQGAPWTVRAAPEGVECGKNKNVIDENCC